MTTPAKKSNPMVLQSLVKSNMMGQNKIIHDKLAAAEAKI